MAVLAVSLLALACGTDDRDLPSPVPGSPTSGAPSAPATASSAPQTSPSTSPLVGGAAGGSLVVDEGLLAILPASVAGVALQPTTDTATGMIADPGLAASASAIAVGMAIAPADYAGNEDLAVATVVQLRPGVGTDAFYAQWRADYDAAACAQAGEVASHDQQTIGSHPTEVTTCAGGATTYHTRLPGDLLVSVTAVGDRGFGDLIIAGLRG